MAEFMLSINLPRFNAFMQQDPPPTVTDMITALEPAIQEARADLDLLQQIAEKFGPDVVMMLASSLPARLSGTRLELVQHALQKAGIPLHTTALAEAIRRHGGPVIKPGAIRSVINKHLADHGDRSPFERVGPATYGLRAWETPETVEG